MFTTFFLKILNREAASTRNHPESIIKSLGIQKGYMIADFGSGGGYFTLKFAENAGSAGRVYAIDINTKYLDFIKRRAEQEGLTNIVVVKAGEELSLPEAGLDLIFVRNVFHHVSDPVKSFSDLKRFLKPGGRVAVIEHRPRRGFSFVALFKHHTPQEVIVQKMESAGYFLSEQFDFLSEQTFSLFNVK
jgi:ubiquinone/menaquinone biosynthesis C-methylase UbiE